MKRSLPYLAASYVHLVILDMMIKMIMVMSIVLMLIIKFFTRDSMIVLLNFKVVKKLFRFNSEHSPQVLRKK